MLVAGMVKGGKARVVKVKKTKEDKMLAMIGGSSEPPKKQPKKEPPKKDTKKESSETVGIGKKKFIKHSFKRF